MFAQVKGEMVSDGDSRLERATNADAGPQSSRPPARRLEVDADRIERWVAGFAERHGETTRQGCDEAVTLTAADGSVATLEPLLANGSWRSSLSEWASAPHAVALILVRRGGYAVGIAAGGELTAHKVGTRYVQSRTAAGGWSQQRYARRRGNQADALVRSVAEHAQRIITGAPGALVVGGDRALVADVLAVTAMARLESLPRREIFDLPDPRLTVLRQALRRGRCVRVVLDEGLRDRQEA